MDQYVVFGNPIKHSRSPFIHQTFARQTHQHISYKTQFVELNDFTQAVQQFIDVGGKGGNVTVPFKEQAFALCDHLSERAKTAGAVNTLSFKAGKVYGDNTDGLGLVLDLLRNSVKLKAKKVLILGAGGATKGVVLPLLAQEPQMITIANRTVSKAQAIAEKYNDDPVFFSGYSELENQTFDVIINATSASLSAQIPAIPANLISANTVCYDMVYGKQLTPFLVWAKKLGAVKIIDGLGMLVGQAAESFKLWRGVLPDTEETLKNIRAEIKSEE